MTPIDPILHADQLLLRLARPSDAEAIAHYYNKNRAVLSPLEPRRPEAFFSAPFWQARIAQNLAQLHEGRSACFFVFAPDDATVIGSANLTNIVGYPLHGAALGYSLDQDLWGRGLMQIALGLLLDWSFEHFNLHRVSANYLPDNHRSGRLLAKLGFEREGYARDYLLIDGLWRDHILTSLVRENWQARDFTANLVEGGSGRLPR